jgi:hypothetical protein
LMLRSGTALTCKVVKNMQACGQCGKPAVAQVGQALLCVDCNYKFRMSQAAIMQNEMAMLNFALAEMDSIIGFSVSPRIQIPLLPNGPVTMNNFKIDNSVVGSINTGNVKSIDVNLNYLHEAGNDKARDAIQALTQAVLEETTLDDDKKNELIEQIAFLSSQATAAAKDRKPSVIKPTMQAINQGAATVSSIASAWQTAEPILKGIFGIG